MEDEEKPSDIFARESWVREWVEELLTRRTVFRVFGWIKWTILGIEDVELGTLFYFVLLVHLQVLTESSR